jgi:ketosteroid isomerase-like protein
MTARPTARAAAVTVSLAAALGLAAAPAFAKMKAPDAQMHFKAVAGGNVAAIMHQYAPDATLHWIGGPLDGSYSGTRAIKSVWSKFAHAMGKMTDKASDIKVATDAKGMTVTANVDFIGPKSVPVRYVLVYRGRKIVDEIWQIAAKKGM